MKIKSILILLFSLLLSLAAKGQTNKVDLSLFPKASAIQRDTFVVGMWFDLVNVVMVRYAYNEDSKQFELENNVVIEAELKSGRTTYILFPEGGTETDIHIYPIINGRGYYINYDSHKVLKKKIIWSGCRQDEKLLELNGLAKGIYYVDYSSCSGGASYLLHIK